MLYGLNTKTSPSRSGKLALLKKQHIYRPRYVIFVFTMSILIHKFMSETGASVSEEFALFS